MATNQLKYSVVARKADVDALYPYVARGQLPPAALMPAAALLNAKRKVEEASDGLTLASVLSWMPKEALTLRVTVSEHDRHRFGKMASICGMSEGGVESAAAAVGALRRLQRDLGPGHTALDIVASVLPSSFVDNWAAKRLRAA